MGLGPSSLLGEAGFAGRKAHRLVSTDLFPLASRVGALGLLLTVAACYSGPSANAGDDGSSSSGNAPVSGTSGTTDGPAGSSGAGDDGSSTGGDEPEEVATYPTRRLTTRELDKTIRAAFELPPEFNSYFLPLKPDEPLQIFSNEVAGLVVGAGVLDTQLEAVERFANRMAVSVTPDDLADCEALDERQCLEAFIGVVGSRLFRRPASSIDPAPLLAVYDEVLAQSDEDTAYAALVMAMVLSPRTLYLLPEPEEMRAWSVAERLSFFVWGAGPDAELSGLAADGTILDPEVLRAQASRMIADERAKENLGLFYIELLDLTRFEFYFKGLEYEADIGLSRGMMRQDFVDTAFALYSQEGTFEALLTEPLAFGEPAMATNYTGEYPGLLSHPVFTWTHANLRSTHPVERGVAIRERLLCYDLGAPPMDISAIPDTVDEDATMRERLAVHREDAACASCHNIIDPLGLPFEGFDWVGRARALENGAPVDVSGELAGLGDPVPVEGVQELGQALSESELAQRCIAQQTLRYALLRETEEPDEAMLQDVLASFQGADLRLDALVLAVATSDAILQSPSEQ